MGIKSRRSPAARSAGRSALRGAVVTTGVAAVGAAMLVGATASTSAGTAAPTGVASVTVVSGDGETAVAAAVPASSPTLYGFAPPAENTAASANPQFRIAANLPNGPLGIPGVVLQAYKLGATRVAAESPQCQLPWFLLAGIGRIESGHAGGGNVDEYGNTRTKIRGPVLDGSLAGNEVITDTDGGVLDGDPRHDRAMGPMQFIPSTWKAWGADANGDGKADPDNIFDAAYSAGRYLCAGVTNIMADAHKVNNILRYNRSVAYANNVLGWAAAYATGVIPTGGIPEMHSAPADPVKKDQKDKDNKDKGKKDKKDKKDAPGQEGPESSAPSTRKAKPTLHQNCLGAICLPPGVGPAPAPAPEPKKAAPKSGAPKATTNKPAAPSR
ncbi:hypothetical protein GOHSU_12_01550 [Gordonia hirsuta DSM 44140 = NBRC 16056]|uniref:Transglycosylase SLT domain-containing protein n=1 Tax=Gordonia hirsuta DSM 44140 = NBRC 16056 TaxID=1121927 RepID=L7L6I4_9ACTN|nr:lytic transglycosylase domain-containing protein [Gordonia hirsuta]GAC56765.1 hypothetical protein GOHSU_12_01550 [Gordonia hirsuta DSM 44140 = NBRC 16056]